MDQCAKKPAIPMPYDEALESQPDLFEVEVSPPQSPWGNVPDRVWAEAFSEACQRLHRVPNGEEIEAEFERLQEGEVARILTVPYNTAQAPGFRVPA